MIRPNTRPAQWQVIPLSVVLALLWVGLQRLVWLVVVAKYPPHPPQWVNAGTIYAFWEFWHGNHGSVGSVQQATMVVNVLLVLFLWAQLRGLPRGSFRQRALQLLAYGGAAGLLAYLQYHLTSISLVEPTYEVIRLDPGTFLLSSP